MYRLSRLRERDLYAVATLKITSKTAAILKQLWVKAIWNLEPQRPSIKNVSLLPLTSLSCWTFQWVCFFWLVGENWQFAQGVLLGFLLLCFPWPDGPDAHKLCLLVFSTWLPKWTLHTLTSLVLLRNIEPGSAPDLLLSWIWILPKFAADSQFLLEF